MKKKNDITIRSSAAEYLTYSAAMGGNGSGVELRYEDENVWLTQRLMAELYGVSVPAINQHLKTIFADGELDENSVVKKFLITAADGKSYNTNHYNLQAIIAVGFKVGNERAVQFRKWAGIIVKEFTIKGWVMDDERLKNGGLLTDKYFEQQLERIQEIRASERKFYQKITDIYATSIDYDSDATATKRFYATVQNKLHYAIHGHTAAELIMERADSDKANMGLTTWQDGPDGKIRKSDVSIAKNYLSEEEISSLNLIVTGYLDFAQSMAKRHIPMTMEDWEKRLNGFLVLWDREVLNDAGKVSAEMAKLYAESEWEKFRIIQDRLYQSDFDRFLQLEEERGKLIQER